MSKSWKRRATGFIEEHNRKDAKKNQLIYEKKKEEVLVIKNNYELYKTKQLDSIVMEKYVRTKAEKMSVFDAIIITLLKIENMEIII